MLSRILFETKNTICYKQKLYPFILNSSSSSYNYDKIFKRSSSNQHSATRLNNLRPNLWVEYASLAAKHNPINLGQGFPDFNPPSFILESLNSVSRDPSLHQYPLSKGLPQLLSALARFYSPQYKRELDPSTEICTSIGAYGVLYSAKQSLINNDDECIVIEPFYDSYFNQTLLAGGKPVFIPLRAKSSNPSSSQEYSLDPDELSAVFNNKTKAIIVNNPNNPLGKVYTREELQMIADLCHKHDVMCISDEVYEFHVYDKNEHVRISTLPGMWDRTITVHSAGKVFSVTGWKLGWAIAPKHLIDGLSEVNANAIYCGVKPIQQAVAQGFEHEIPLIGTPESYFFELKNFLQDKRDLLAGALNKINMKTITPAGSYFIMADTSSLRNLFNEDEYGTGTFDQKLARWMYSKVGVGVIPPSGFYSDKNANLASNYLRFSFCKTTETLQSAIDRLMKITA